MASRGYNAIYNARRSGTLYAQAESFLLTKAVPDVKNEDPGTPDHADRVAWAVATETSEAELAIQVRRLLIYLVQNPTIAAAAASDTPAEDSDVEFVGLASLDDLIAQHGGA